MPAKAVQISIEANLLARIDRDPQTKREGRSAFVADAVRLYLSAKRRRATDEALARAFAGKKNAVLDEVESMLEGQAWPKT
jgi:metal-responsive CopG/Arc/MetJ family transcriptional regulator